MSYPRIGRGVKRGIRKPTSGGKKRDSRSKEISSIKKQLSKQIKQSRNRPSRPRRNPKETSSFKNKLSKQIKQSRKNPRRGIRRRPKMFGGPRRVRRVRRRR